MTKQSITPNYILFSGKARDIKNELNKLLISTNSRETVSKFTHRSAEFKR
ncbi:hypothetical protein [Paenibacillus camelliae]|nr:hypothetical protein [Paenibacillus camelliae]MCM3633135.1 hypothetical protein [Paenibacillus camelliae]